MLKNNGFTIIGNLVDESMHNTFLNVLLRSRTSNITTTLIVQLESVTFKKNSLSCNSYKLNQISNSVKNNNTGLYVNTQSVLAQQIPTTAEVAGQSGWGDVNTH